jgi:hypothetical protein
MRSRSFSATSRLLCAGWFVAAMFLAAHLRADQPPAKSAEKPPAKSEAERISELEKTLSNATLVGHYTTVGEQETPAEERYDLGEVKHLDKDQWSIAVRIRYRDKDVQLPIVVPIRWAGDTPVICVDDLTIPALGTYTARVMIYRDHYAGFWTGHGHGGHLYGLVKHDEGKSDVKKDNPEKSGAKAR